MKEATLFWPSREFLSCYHISLDDKFENKLEDGINVIDTNILQLMDVMHGEMLQKISTIGLY